MKRTKQSVMPSDTLKGSITEGKGKGKTIPLYAYYRCRGFQEFEDPSFRDNRQIKLASLSAIRTGRLYPSRNIPGIHLCQRPSRPLRHYATRRIMSIKIEPATFRLVAQCLNQMCHRVPQSKRRA